MPCAIIITYMIYSCQSQNAQKTQHFYAIAPMKYNNRHNCLYQKTVFGTDGAVCPKRGIFVFKAGICFKIHPEDRKNEFLLLYIAHRAPRQRLLKPSPPEPPQKSLPLWKHLQKSLPLWNHPKKFAARIFRGPRTEGVCEADG